MKQGLVPEGVTLEALGDSAKAIEPGKEPLDHPTVAGEFPVSAGTVFEFSVIGRSPQGNAVADAAPNQREPKGLAVVTPVCRQATGASAGSTSSARDSYLRQGQRGGGDIGHVTGGQMHR